MGNWINKMNSIISVFLKLVDIFYTTHIQQIIISYVVEVMVAKEKLGCINTEGRMWAPVTSSWGVKARAKDRGSVTPHLLWGLYTFRLKHKMQEHALTHVPTFAHAQVVHIC